MKKRIIFIALMLLTFCQVVFAADFELLTVKTRKSGIDDFTEIMGQIQNNTNKSYEIVMFNLNIYSADKELLEVTPLIIPNFPKKSKKSFKDIIQIVVPKEALFELELDTTL
ncbi:hypothetical protein RBH88_03215 [Aminobacterium sp. MB27-C1]|uniref:hypothetical protein n=1 Tax=Aminobacterium sp. MB27-C1 TaxID=3070661 RepID=UPI0027DD0698|nr:hypothetical protein [Aminobacterium sp. MB27-C1]WMI72123.1 hypothetical protein RBH88_03215 [Aminobacterium sp. MB27-C1]